MLLWNQSENFYSSNLWGKVWTRSIWETHLANELWETDIELDAVLDQLVISLNDVVNWKPGSQMMLNAVPTSPIELRCGEIPLFVGSMGQKGGNMAVKVDKKLRNM